MTERTSPTAAEIVGAQGVSLDLSDTDLVAGCVLLTKVVSEEGYVSLTINSSDGMSWLDQLGIVVAAHDIIRTDGFTTRDHDEDDD